MQREFKIDGIVTDEELQNHANQIGDLNADITNQLDQLYGGERSDEFYLGLLSGFANAYAIANGIAAGSDTNSQIAAVIIYLANKRVAQPQIITH